jgi:hypothetical protein
MLSGKKRQEALRKNIEHAHNMARELRAEDVDEITLTYYDNEESFRAMKLPEEGDDFGFRQLVNAETAKVMLEHGLHLTVQILNAKEYFEPLISLTQAWPQVVVGPVETGGGDGSAAGLTAGVRGAVSRR